MSRAPRWRVGGKPKEEQKEGPSRIGKSLPFPSNDPASPGSSTVRSPFPPYAPPAQAYHASRLRRFRQTVFASSAILPAGCMAGCPSLLRSVRLWITGTNVVEWNSRRVTRSTVPRCEVQVVMITPGYALAPLTGTPEPANARETRVGRSSIHPTGGVDNEATFTTFSLLSL
ncbi:UNVERIFIED_CONTAM: hypothetical protein Scaly_3121600, partial [Sesamum calycinum]